MVERDHGAGLQTLPHHQLCGGREFSAVDSEFLCVELHGGMQVMGYRRPGRLNLTPLPSDIDIWVPTLQSDACRTSALERDKAAKHCCVHLPDGTSCVVAVKSGFSIKEILSGLCERHGINGAAVDLFLVGGDKVLCQTGMSHQYPGPVYSLPSGLVSAHSCHHHYPLPVTQCRWKWRLPGVGGCMAAQPGVSRVSG